MSVDAVRPPPDDRLRAQPGDLLPDPLGDLLRVAFVDAAVGIIPQLDAADGQRGRARIQLRPADLREILLPAARRLAVPTALAPRRPDEAAPDTIARVPHDQPP